MFKKNLIIIKKTIGGFTFPLSVETDNGWVATVANNGYPITGYAFALNGIAKQPSATSGGWPVHYAGGALDLDQSNEATLTLLIADGLKNSELNYSLTFGYIEPDFVRYPLNDFIASSVDVYRSGFVSVPYPQAKGQIINWPSGSIVKGEANEFTVDWDTNAKNIIASYIMAPIWLPSNTLADESDIEVGYMANRLAIKIPDVMIPEGETFSLISRNEDLGDCWSRLREGIGQAFAMGDIQAEDNFPLGLYDYDYLFTQVISSLYANANPLHYYSFQVVSKPNATLTSLLKPISIDLGVFENGTKAYVNGFSLTTGKYLFTGNNSHCVISCYIPATQWNLYMAGQTRYIVPTAIYWGE